MWNDKCNYSLNDKIFILHCLPAPQCIPGYCLDGQGPCSLFSAAGAENWQCHSAPVRGESRRASLNVALPTPCTAPPWQSPAGAQSVGSCQPNVVLCTASQVSAAAKFLLCLKVTLAIQPRARCCYLCLCRDSLLPWGKLVAAGLCILQWQKFSSFLLHSLVVSGWWCFMPSAWGIFLFPFALSLLQMDFC